MTARTPAPHMSRVLDASAAFILCHQLPQATRKTLLRIMWRMVPVKDRGNALLESIRPCAPARLKGLPVRSKPRQ